MNNNIDIKKLVAIAGDESTKQGAYIGVDTVFFTTYGELYHKAKCEQAEAVAWVSEASLQALESGKDAIAGIKTNLRSRPLYTTPPDQTAEIERLKAQRDKLLASLKLALIEMLALPRSLGLEITHTIDMELLIKEIEESK